MRPDARVAAAIEVLSTWAADAGPAERLLAAWGRGNRYAGSGDRRAVADLVYDAIRRKRSALWAAGYAGPEGAGIARPMMLGALSLAGADLEGLFSGRDHAPPALTPAERAALRPVDEAPRAIRLDLPDWAEPYLDHVPEAALSLLGERAPLDLRANRLRGSREDALATLMGDGISAAPLTTDPDALRVLAQGHRVRTSAAYLSGLVEIQDASSQRAARFAAAQPGETVLDYCAGGGGKSLAFASQMENRGRIIAHDVSAARLSQIAPRAARAGAVIEIAETGGLDALRQSCDLVFVDAPCSGSGAWRRNAEEKWRLTPDALRSFSELQRRVLEGARACLAPQGRLIYATCSLFRPENEDQVAAFLADHPEMRLNRSLALTELGEGDGFYMAELVLCPQK
ncbi:MAG: RsmB/NOP family class I SAM-dependent RNA methyltransferase [Pseudomonadota bacterium]